MEPQQDTAQAVQHIPDTLRPLAVPIDSLSYYPGNARRGDVPRIRKSLRRFGQYRPITARLHSGVVICGNHTLQGAREEGWDEIAVTFVDVSDDEAARIVLTDNALSDAAENDAEAMAAMLADIPDWRETIPGLEDYEVADLTGSKETKPQGNLADMFGVPPFSVLDARQGTWKERKDGWKALGIQSELGRDGALVYESPQTMYRNWYEVKNAAVAAEGRKMADKEILASAWAGRLERMNDGGGTSIFDPVLTELMYRWFAPAGGHVLDPWAGGSVRGIVASRLGRRYTGIELRGEQVEANRAQLHIASPLQPEWIEGESTEQLEKLEPGAYDMILGCPPYYDLETYSADPRDLSNMSKEEFDAAMVRNVAAAVRCLKDDSYAVFVVGGVRDKKGALMDMRSLMIDAAYRAGMVLHNDAILLTPVGSIRLHAAKQFVAARTLSRTHQDVLVFLKGDKKRAAGRMSMEETQATLETLEGGEDDGSGS